MESVKDFIGQYDSFGWVPTIKGALSLSLVDDAGPIFGDVDRYVVAFYDYDENERKHHYIAATSVQTVIDQKFGPKYQHSFRYIFVGEIPPTEKSEKRASLLTGMLYIVLVENGKFSRTESDMLKAFADLNKKDSEYELDFHIKAVQMSMLKTGRKTTKKMWDRLNEKIDAVVSLVDGYNKSIVSGVSSFVGIDYDVNKLGAEDWARITSMLRPFFKMKVALTRDGIVLLKNCSELECTRMFAEPGTDDDYTKHVPIHRIFKMAMNYVKYLFHRNYYHNEVQDNFLPASNIWAARDFDINKAVDTTRIFNHQLGAFLHPITLLKRNISKDNGYLIDGNGVLCYAKAFVQVFADNNLISKELYEETNNYLQIQEAEYNVITSNDKSMVKNFIANNNRFVRITSITALTLTLWELFKICMNDKLTKIMIEKSETDIYLLSGYQHWYDNWFYILSLWLVSYYIYQMAYVYIAQHQFVRKRDANHHYKGESDLYSHCFSLSYRLWLKKAKFIQNHFVLFSWTKILFYFILLIVMGWLCYHFFFNYPLSEMIHFCPHFCVCHDGHIGGN